MTAESTPRQSKTCFLSNGTFNPPPPISGTESSAQETVLHIFKRRMGLTKRGGYESETLTIRSVSVSQTDTFTVHETSNFVQLIIPTAHILQTKVGTALSNCNNDRDDNNDDDAAADDE